MMESMQGVALVRVGLTPRRVPRARGSYILGRVSVYTPGAVEVTIHTEDGWTLRGERLVEDRAPVVAVLGHAMMVDRRTMDRPAGAGLASTLHAAGLDVTSFDARGHGQSGPRAEEGARWSYDDIVRFDAPAMVTWGRRIAEGRPVVLLGHSLFGHAGLIAAGLNPETAPDGLVAYAANLLKPSMEPSALRRAQKSALLHGFEWVTRLGGYFDTRRFGLGGAAEAEPYVRDFARMWRADHFGDGLGADYEAAMGRARVDLLSVSSRNDHIFATVASVERFTRMAWNADVETLVLSGADAPDHIGFVTDPRSKKLWQTTANWILARADDVADSACP